MVESASLFRWRNVIRPDVFAMPIPGWTTYVIHPAIFNRKLYNGEKCSTIWQNKTHFYTILTTNLYDKSQTKVPYRLVMYGTFYIDNIQKAVVICLIIPTIFPSDFGSRVDNVRHTSMYFFMLDPASKGNIVGMIRQMTTAFGILSM